MKTIDYCKGNWSVIFSHFGLPPISKRHFPGECPLCGGIGKIRIDNRTGNGDYICRCGAGNGIKLVMGATGKEFKEVAREIHKLLNIDFKKERVVSETKSKEKMVIDYFKKLPSLVDSNALEYFKNRGISDYKSIPKHGSKFMSKTKEDATVGAILSMVTDDNYNVIYTHKTFIKDGKKADITPQKKLEKITDLEEIHFGVSIKLFECAETLGIAEGIETAVSCKQVYKINTWSTINNGFMKKFKAPKNVKNLYIFADSDKNCTGQSAAFECARANLLANNDLEYIRVCWASKQGVDFNDILQDPTCSDVLYQEFFKKKVDK